MIEGKKTVILGASPNRDRYSYFAAEQLDSNGIDYVPVGMKKGSVLGKEILDLRTKPAIDNVDTVTLYMNARNQKDWEEYILDFNPKRIIFNPGAENPSLFEKAQKRGIEVLAACTLTMLTVGLY